MKSGELHSIIQNIIEAFNKKDLTRLISFFEDDAIIIQPEGTFRGKEEIKRYHSWSFSNFPDLTLMEKDFISEENKAVLEFVKEWPSARGGSDKQQFPGLASFEFRNGKVQQSHDYYDRLLIAQQGASGWLEKKIINAIVNRMDKGLR
ncbi:MAG: nuclear transport factor 2 family protein [Candidatus Bathyarchaeia archaeon]